MRVCVENIEDLLSYHFHVYNSVSSNIVTVLYIRAPERVHLITGIVCPWPTSHFPQPQAPDSSHSTENISLYD